jgi:hypothetical protein
MHLKPMELIMLRDLKSNVGVGVSLPPAARAAAVGTGSFVDTLGKGSAMAVVQFGDWTDGAHTPSLQGSNDGTNGTALGTADLDGSFTAVSGTAGENTIQKVGIKANFRHYRVMMSIANGTTGALSEAHIVTSHANFGPVA